MSNANKIGSANTALIFPNIWYYNTLDAELKIQTELKLQQHDIDYIARHVTPSKINLFFRNKKCVDVIDKIGSKSLNEFTPEEDFVLGTMLGYDRLQ